VAAVQRLATRIAVEHVVAAQATDDVFRAADELRMTCS
jgi:hypothetical protein